MMSYRSLSIFAILNVYLYFSTGFAANPCFFPDGSSDPAFVPCSPNGDGSCCFSSDTCTQYGYCLNISTGYHYRGACTDSAWLNPSCPDYCLDNENSGNKSSVNIIACDASQTGGAWCCAYDGNCCSSSTFHPTFGTMFAIQGSSSTSSVSNSRATTSTTNVAASTSACTTPSSTTTASCPTETYVSDSKKVTQVGAGVGVSLGVLALAGFAAFFLERRKRIAAVKEAKQNLSQQPESSSVTQEWRRYELPPNKPRVAELDG